MRWSDYALRTDINRATKEDLIKVVARAAKVANQRLRMLEARGYQESVAYLRAMKDLGGDIEKIQAGEAKPKRYKERTARMSINDLRSEYRKLGSFLQQQSTTITGIKEVALKRYKTAVARGYSGTINDFERDVVRVFTKQKEYELSSDLVYRYLVEGEVDVLEEVLERSKDGEVERALLTRYLEISKREKSNDYPYINEFNR